jgi:hypothetical protein
MRASSSSPASRRRLRGLAVVLVATLLAALGGTVPAAVGAGSPAPVTIVVDAVTSDVAAPAGTPSGAVPTVLVQVGGTVHVHVSFFDASGAPASFSKDTTLALSSDQGGLVRATGTAARQATTATIDTSFSTPLNRVSLTVSVPGKAGTGVAPGTLPDGKRFDVVRELRLVPAAADTALQTGIGGDDANCQNATPTQPVCGIALLPHGTRSAQVLLSLGLCDQAYAACGSPQGSVVQVLAGLTGLYTKTDPAGLLMKCDKSLCGGGQIQAQHLSFSLNGNDPLRTADPCPAKGTVGQDQAACVDYVQSKRDGSGDTLLYLLFTQDMRGSVG